MNKDYTDITLILDRSGSMQSIAEDVCGGMAAFLEEQRKLPGKCLLSLHRFDTQYESVFEGKPISEVQEIVVCPRGGTALLDAIGRTINSLGSRLAAMPETERPAKVVVTIITDGEENSSVEFKKDQISEMIKHQREKYNWVFVFLAANQDAIQVGGELSVPTSASLLFGANARGVANTVALYSANIMAVRSNDVEEAQASMSFSAADRAEALGTENN